MFEKKFQSRTLPVLVIFSIGLSACQPSNLPNDINTETQAASPTIPLSNDQTEDHSDPVPTQPEPTPTQPEPVQLAVPEPANRDQLVENADGSLYVVLDEEQIVGDDRPHLVDRRGG